MLHSLSRACMFAALCGLLFVPSVSWGQDHRVRHVQDDAGLFTQAARDQADATITQIADRHHKELFIETVKEGPADKDARTAWAKERFNNFKVNGVYVVFSKEPKFYRIEVGNKTLTDGYFRQADVRRLEDLLKAAPSYDEKLAAIASHTLTTMNEHPPQQKAKGRAQQQPVQNQPVNHRDHAEGGMPPWVGWLCMIGGVLLIVWVVYALITAMTGMGGYGYGGYPGYGYGGFFPGFLGGMFGVMGGMWMYNTFFGGHADYATGDWGGGAAGAAGDGGDTGVGASGGADDDGGGAGGGGGDDDIGGAADAGGGGGDDGGGGWFGGGDAGGGDAGGAGCGGGGCGGGGCGGGGD